MAHIPNYKRNYQYRSKQPYYLFPSERNAITHTIQYVTPYKEVLEPIVNVIGNTALASYVAAVSAGEYAKYKKKQRLQRHLQDMSDMIPPLIGGPINVPENPEVGERIQEILDEPIILKDIGELPDSDVYIDFDAPPGTRYIRPGVLADSTLDKNAVLIRMAIGQVGYDDTMKDRNIKRLAGYDLFTPEGLREALFDPTRYIPNSVRDITSPSLKEVLYNEKRLKIGKIPERDRKQAYKQSAKEKYRNDIRAQIIQNNPNISYEDQENEVERNYNILLGKEYI